METKTVLKIFKDLVLFYKKNKWSVLQVLILLGMVGMAYLMFNQLSWQNEQLRLQNEQLVEQNQELLNSQSPTIEETFDQDTLIEERLEKLLIDSKADRATLSQFSNTEKSIAGYHHWYITLSHCVHTRDVSCSWLENTKVPIREVKTVMDTLREDIGICVDDITELDVSEEGLYRVASQGVVSTCMLYLKDDEGEGIGVLAIDFQDKVEDVKKYINVVGAASTDIKHILLD